MSDTHIVSVLAAILAVTLVTGCSKEMVGGAAIGAAGAGAAYEYHNKRQMDQLDNDFKAGKINKEEYYERKRQIERGSIIY